MCRHHSDLPDAAVLGRARAPHLLLLGPAGTVLPRTTPVLLVYYSNTTPIRLLYDFYTTPIRLLYFYDTATILLRSCSDVAPMLLPTPLLLVVLDCFLVVCYCSPLYCFRLIYFWPFNLATQSLHALPATSTPPYLATRTYCPTFLRVPSYTFPARCPVLTPVGPTRALCGVRY